MPTKHTIPKEILEVASKLKKADFSAFLVGGCTRDLELNRPPKDWDFTTNARPEQIIALFSKTYYENNFGTVTIVNEETDNPALREIQITPYRREGKYSDNRHPDSVTFSDNVLDDLGRRDFTMNAIALDPITGEVIDPYDGRQAIAMKEIKAVGIPEDRFKEDGLRILRAIRLSTELGFTINKETFDAICSTKNLLSDISSERVRDEFTRIIMAEKPMDGLILARNMGIFDVILVELSQMFDVKQNGDHIYDVWNHSIRALQHAADREWPLQVRLAALLHDIGKPKTRRWSDEKGDFTFYGHDVVGARIAEKFLSSLRYPKKLIDTVIKMVRNHMFFTDIDKITLSAVRRIVRNVGTENVWDLMNVRACDRIGMKRPKEKPYRLRKYESMIEEALRAPTSVTMLAIDGAGIMATTKLPPGPKIGFILHALLEEVLDDPSKNVSEQLQNRALQLSKMTDDDLMALGEEGKKKKEAAEEAALGEIRSRHHVQ